MTEKKHLIQDIELVGARELLATVHDIHTAGYRLGQACASMAGEEIEVLYSFEKDNVLKSYKTIIDARAPELQSITAVYPYAFIYENEMHDLFGIVFKNLTFDYGGKYIVIAKPTPCNPILSEGGEN